MNLYYKIDPREEGLPKWVQEHLNHLRRSIRTLQDALEQDVSDANTFLRGPHGVEPEALGKNVRVIFRVGEGKRHWARDMTVHTEDGVLKIMSDATVSIRPTASNVLEIRMDDR